MIQMQRNERYLSILENIKKPEDENINLNDRVLIIDGLNTFIRCFVVNPATNDDGVHIGGMTGFLKSIGYAIRMHNPTRCIVVFDGKGGSQRRRKVYPDYKANRKVKHRFNRAYDFNSVDDEQQSMRFQVSRLVEYLSCLPLTTIMIENIEADDTMAYLSKRLLKSSEVILMSTDKDFIQLVNDRISVWSPTKKKLYTPEVVKEEFQVPSHNFVMYRVIDGDKSDNVPGIKGFGLKSLIKKVPKILEDEKVTTDDLIAEGFDTDIINRNYELMQLDDVNISGKSKLEIQHLLTDTDIKMIKYEFQKMMLEDKANTAILNLDSWLAETFNKLNIIAMNNNDR